MKENSLVSFTLLYFLFIYLFFLLYFLKESFRGTRSEGEC